MRDCFLLHCAFFLFYTMKLLLRSVQCIVVHAELLGGDQSLEWYVSFVGTSYLWEPISFAIPSSIWKKRNNKIFKLSYKPLEDM